MRCDVCNGKGEVYQSAGHSGHKILVLLQCTACGGKGVKIVT